MPPDNRYLFPRWANQAPTIVAVGLAGFVALVAFVFWYYATNKFLEVGYEPAQPIEYSHKLHAGEMGVHCRYCHSTVERAGFAAVPPTQVCMNCHQNVKQDSPRLTLLREAWAADKPIPWVKVHNVADYVYFNHSAHLAVGVGCASCHGRVDQMIRVKQVEPLSMGWCVDCHRNPAPHLRPASVSVTDMAWQPIADATGPAVARNGRTVNPPTHCSGCHR